MIALSNQTRFACQITKNRIPRFAEGHNLGPNLYNFPPSSRIMQLRIQFKWATLRRSTTLNFTALKNII